jgi:hypothetical protein
MVFTQKTERAVSGRLGRLKSTSFFCIVSEKRLNHAEHFFTKITLFLLPTYYFFLRFFFHESERDLHGKGLAG